jgi:hypothetical protein
MKVLKAKLYQLDREKKETLKKSSMLGFGENSWGNQIRLVILSSPTTQLPQVSCPAAIHFSQRSSIWLGDFQCSRTPGWNTDLDKCD